MVKYSDQRAFLTDADCGPFVSVVMLPGQYLLQPSLSWNLCASASEYSASETLAVSLSQFLSMGGYTEKKNIPLEHL